MERMSTYYITTPIYYVNDVPHIGHAYTTVAADVLARHYRRRGFDVFFLTGTDEHGAKIAEAAAKHGLTPKAYVDGIVERFKEAWRALEISNDFFIRTSDPHHEAGVAAFLQTLFDAGEIYKGVYEGLYCVGCEQFKTEEDLVNGLCPYHNIAPTLYSEENYFFRLSRYQETLLRALTDPADPNHYAVNPPTRLNEVLGKIRLGLSDVSISRASLTWGVPLPFDPTQVAYVWIDALLNYVTAIGYPDDLARFRHYWPADLHLMAKDILWFHAILWPAMLIAGGLRPPKEVFAHGFFTIGGQRMSKTLGNVIAPADLVARFGADAARYLLVTDFPFGTDGDFNLDSLVTRYNAELANDLGNLLNRTVSMVNRFTGGAVPTPGAGQPVDDELKSLATGAFERMDRAFEALDFMAAADAVRDVVTRANRYIEEMAPWQLARTNQDRLATVLYTLVEAERLIAVALWPFMPAASDRMLDQLGLRGQTSTAWGVTAPSTRVSPQPRPLFPRIESGAASPR
ncbi:MAG: methionine--tRNA ligase [Chloroflexi bacterium]|jgi:methionyl-tRNA synthetase|nr:methionine--tRNA ligase [Chloroflexota bacterium]